MIQFRIEYLDEEDRVIAFDIVTVESRNHAKRKALSRMLIVQRKRGPISNFRIKQMVE